MVLRHRGIVNRNVDFNSETFFCYVNGQIYDYYGAITWRDQVNFINAMLSALYHSNMMS